MKKDHLSTIVFRHEKSKRILNESFFRHIEDKRDQCADGKKCEKLFIDMNEDYVRFEASNQIEIFSDLSRDRTCD